MKLASWKEYFEGRTYSSGTSSMKVSDEEECVISKHTVECENEECSVTWMKVESWLLS